jgi:hypothetical protein
MPKYLVVIEAEEAHLEQNMGIGLLRIQGSFDCLSVDRLITEEEINDGADFEVVGHEVAKS